MKITNVDWVPIRGGAGKSLAQPNSRCRRMESIVSLERGICSCANCKFFLVTDAERRHVRRRARFQQRRDASSHQFFFLQFKAPKEIHAILRETLEEDAPSYATFKIWVAKSKHGDFSTRDAPRPGRPKTETTLEITDQIHELISKEDVPT